MHVYIYIRAHIIEAAVFTGISDMFQRGRNPYALINVAIFIIRRQGINVTEVLLANF